MNDSSDLCVDPMRKKLNWSDSPTQQKNLSTICCDMSYNMYWYIVNSSIFPTEFRLEFLKDSAIICNIPIRDVEKHQRTTLVIDVFQLLRSEFLKWFQNSLRIPSGNLIGIPLEKTVESSFYSIIFDSFSDNKMKQIHILPYQDSWLPLYFTLFLSTLRGAVFNYVDQYLSII